MAKIKTSSYGAYKVGENNDCAVRAVVNVTGIEYDTIHAAFKGNGRKDNAGTNHIVLFKTMKDLGMSYVGSFGKTKPARFAEMISGTFYDVTKDHINQSLTLGNLVKALPFGKFVVCISGHALALVDGKIIDCHYDLPAKAQVVCMFQFGEMI